MNYVDARWEKVDCQQRVRGLVPGRKGRHVRNVLHRIHLNVEGYLPFPNLRITSQGIRMSRLIRVYSRSLRKEVSVGGL